MSFGEQSFDALTLSAELQDSDRLTGKLRVTTAQLMLDIAIVGIGTGKFFGKFD